mgnify:CR=1 FL=1
MALGFHEVRLDTNESYGSSGGPGFVNVVFESDSRHDQVVQRGAVARHRFDISKSLKDLSDLAIVKDFYLARNGSANGWRLKDWWDYHSNPANPTYNDAQGVADQDCIPALGTGSLTQFQLSKRYTSGPTSYVRPIYKPVDGTTQVWLDAVEQTTGWSVDTTTGLVTFTVAPGNGVTVKASFEFDVPVRFDQSADRLLSATINDFASGTIGSIVAVEILNPGPSSHGEFSYGGARERVINSNITLSLGLGRFWNLSASIAGLSAVLPDPTELPTGAPLFYVSNGGSENISLQDHLAAVLVTLAPDECVEVLLSVDSLGDPTWEVS